MKESCKELSKLTIKVDYIYNEFRNELSTNLLDEEIDNILINYYHNRFSKLFNIDVINISDKSIEDKELMFVYVTNIKYLTHNWLDIIKIYKSLSFDFEVKSIMEYIEKLNISADKESSKLDYFSNNDKTIIDLSNEYIIENNLTDENFKKENLAKYI